MARKAKRDLTVSEQLARGPVDLPFLMLTLLLLGVGLIMVLSASYATAYYDKNTASPLAYALAQSRYAVVGLVLMYFMSKLNYERLRGLSAPLLIGSALLLVMVLTPLGVVVNNAQRWLKLLFVAGPTYQPSEIAKVAVILFFSARLSKRGTEKKRKWNRRTNFGRLMERLDRIGLVELMPYGGILLGFALLLLKEPHLSGTILVLVGGVSVMFASGVNWGWVLAGILSGAGALAVVIKFTPYMTSRIRLWRDPWFDAQGKGYQTIQSLYAIGSGACSVWVWGRADRNTFSCPNRKTISSSPSPWRSWASWAAS